MFFIDHIEVLSEMYPDCKTTLIVRQPNSDFWTNLVLFHYSLFFIDLASWDHQFYEINCWDSVSIEHFEISTKNKMAAKITDFDKYYYED